DAIPDLGYSNSPIIDGELLLVTGLGGMNRSLLAFDKMTGRRVWSSHQDHPGYSSPIIISAHGVRQAVFFTGTKIVAVSPADGKVLWTHPWRTDSFENVATPIFISNDKLFFSSAHPKEAGSAVLQIKATNGKVNAETVWKNNLMQHHFASSVFYKGFLYGTDRAILKCVDAGTGKGMWKQRGFGEGSLIFADGHLIVLGTSGNLALVEATPAAYKEKAGAQILNGKCFTAPALANGKLYLRNETEMICLDLEH
ncbi:MAG: PQQ-binding-like beta-propeller repeat protein, partial [bacterium]